MIETVFELAKFQTKMNIVNQYSDVLELIVVKAPHHRGNEV